MFSREQLQDTITLWNALPSSPSSANSYQKTVIGFVRYREARGVTVITDGITVNDMLTLIIDFQNSDPQDQRSYVEPEAFAEVAVNSPDDLVKYYTLKDGTDIIVTGVYEDDSIPKSGKKTYKIMNAKASKSPDGRGFIKVTAS